MLPDRVDAVFGTAGLKLTIQEGRTEGYLLPSPDGQNRRIPTLINARTTILSEPLTGLCHCLDLQPITRFLHSDSVGRKEEQSKQN